MVAAVTDGCITLFIGEVDMSGIDANYSASSALQYEALKTSLNERIRNALKAQQDAKRASEAEFAAAQLRPASRNAETKAAAAQRVQQIKEQIRMLTMMGGVGDPRANAGQIARLARELAAAVHEYASASGTAADAYSTPAATTGGAAASPTAATATPSATPTAATTETTTETTATPASTETETAATDAESAQDAGKSGLQGLVQGTNPASAADQAFIRDVRDLAEKLKALARQQQARMQQGEQNGDLSATRDAIAEIGKGLSDIASQTPRPSVNIFA